MRLVIIIILQVIYIYLENDRALLVYVCSIFIAEKEIRLCKSIAKFSQNLPFSACKILRFGRKIWDFFVFAKKKKKKKPQGQAYIRLCTDNDFSKIFFL